MNWTDYLGFNPATDAGWIPPDERTSAMALVHERMMSRTPLFGDLVPTTGAPEWALMTYLELKHFKRPLWRIHQLTGSCVGAGGARAYGQAIVGDLEYRGDNEAIEPMFPWATYGQGRQMGGLRGRGDGSFGAAQAEAVEQWGMLRGSDPRAPQPTDRNGWLSWTKNIELDWSWPPGWREKIPKADAQQYAIGDIVRIKSSDEAADVISRGYAITQASSFGSRGPRLTNGVMLAKWDSSWAHQMSTDGYATHPQLGRIWKIDNQWGRDAHPPCPYFQGLVAKWCEELRITDVPTVGGSLWIDDWDYDKICRNGEVFGHAATKGFDPRPPFSWDASILI